MTRDELLDEQIGFIRAVMDKYGLQAFEITTTENPQIIEFPDFDIPVYAVEFLSYESNGRQAKNDCLVSEQTQSSFKFTAPDRYPTGTLIFKIIKKTVL